MISLFRQGALEPPVTTALSSADPTTIHTASTKYMQIVEAIVLANVDTTNACAVTLRWVNATPTAVVFWQGDVAAGETVVIDNIAILTDGRGLVRSISAEAENADDIVVTVITSAQTKQAQA